MTFTATTLAIGEEGTTSTYGEEDYTTDTTGEEDTYTSEAIGEEDGGPYTPEYQSTNPFGAY